MLFYLLYSEFDSNQLMLKFLSIVSFYVVNGGLLLLSKALFAKTRGKYVYFVLIALTVIMFPMVYTYATYYNGYSVCIGANVCQGPHIYTLITPITVLGSNVSDYLVSYPMLVNIVFVLLGILGLFFIKKMKNNW